MFRDPETNNPNFQRKSGEEVQRRTQIPRLLSFLGIQDYYQDYRNNALRFYEETYLGIQYEPDIASRYRVDPHWQISMPVKEGDTLVMSEAPEQTKPPMAKSYRIKGSKPTYVDLEYRHLLRHMAWKDQDLRSLHKKYYWICLRGGSLNEHPPPSVCLTLRNCIGKNKAGSVKTTNTVIRELYEALGQATPLIYSLPSGHPYDRQVYFLLEEEVCMTLNLHEIREHIRRIISPVLKKHTGLTNFSDQLISYYPDPNRYNVLPLGMNSQLYKMSGSEIVLHQKEGPAGKEEPDPFKSLLYQYNLGKKGQIRRLTLSGLRGLAEEVSPIKKARKKKVTSGQWDSKFKPDARRVQGLEHLYMTSDLDSLATLMNFLTDELVPELVKAYSDGKGHVEDWPAIHSSVLNWLSFSPELLYSFWRIKQCVSGQYTLAHLAAWAVKDVCPEYSYKAPDTDVTKGLYQYLLDQVNSPIGSQVFPEPNKRVRALLLISYILYYSNPKKKALSKGKVIQDQFKPAYEGVCPNGRHVYTVQIAVGNLYSWDITGMSKTRYKEYLTFLEKVGLLRVDYSFKSIIGGEAPECRKFSIYLPYDLSKSEYNVSSEPRFMLLILFGQKLLTEQFPKCYNQYFDPRKIKLEDN